MFMLPDLLETVPKISYIPRYLNEVPSYCTSQGGSCGRILRSTFGSRHSHRSRKNKEPVKIANSSIINGGTGTIYIFMATLAL